MTEKTPKTSYKAICSSLKCAPLFAEGWSGPRRNTEEVANTDLVEHRKTHDKPTDWRNNSTISTVLTINE